MVEIDQLTIRISVPSVDDGREIATKVSNRMQRFEFSGDKQNPFDEVAIKVYAKQGMTNDMIADQISRQLFLAIMEL